MDIEFEKMGKIIGGDADGSYVCFVHDNDRDGYIIYISREKRSNPNREIYDYWFPDIEEMMDHIEGSGWKVEWLDQPFF